MILEIDESKVTKKYDPQKSPKPSSLEPSFFAPISHRRLLRASHKTQLKKARSLNVGVKQQIRE